MPKSQSSGVDKNTNISNTNALDSKLVQQESQTLPSVAGLKTTEQILLEQARMSDALCILLIFAVITSSVITFCITRSPLSFSFFTLFSLIPAIRRRKEEAMFPISQEDLQIKLKELDVEMERIKKQNAATKPLLYNWLKRITGG